MKGFCLVMSKDMSPYSIQKIVPKTPGFPDDFMRTSPAPAQVYITSDNWEAIMTRPRVAIVGSRKASLYGRHATEQLASDLARAGVVIVSGLAIGIDAIAHRACLRAGGITVAVLPGAIQEVYPPSHVGLAQQIVAQGGALITEYDKGTRTYPANFIARNRLVAGLSHVILVTEASEKSGTMHTARFALEQGKDVLAVPGMITSATSRGTHNLIKSGAALVASVEDILHVLGIKAMQKRQPTSNDPYEQQIIDLLTEKTYSTAELINKTGLSIQHFNQAITMLEINGIVRPLGNTLWGL